MTILGDGKSGIFREDTLDLPHNNAKCCAIIIYNNDNFQ